MSRLGLISEELNRLRIKAKFDGTDLSMMLGEDEIQVREDEENGRLALWAEVARNVMDEAFRVTLLTMQYNDENAFQRDVVLALDETSDAIILGRSVEADRLDPQGVIAQTKDFREVLALAKPWFAKALAAARLAPADAPSELPDADDHKIAFRL